MPLTILNAPADNLWQCALQLPDSGTTVTVSGCVNPGGIDGQTDTTMTPATLTAPTPPGSGSIYWLIEVNTTTGVVDILQSTTGFPANSVGCVTIFQQTLASGQSDPALVPTDVTPNS